MEDECAVAPFLKYVGKRRLARREYVELIITP
jgi:hypothetical protein